MPQLSMPSPTPVHVADAYRELVKERASSAAGRDGRVSLKEASTDPLLSDAYERAGRQRARASTLASAGREGMLAAAKQASGGDGRVSKADAQKMPAVFAQAFVELRGDKSA